MDIDIQSVVGLHLQSRLHSGRRKRSLGRVRRNSRRHQTADFGKAGLHIVILLGIIVTRYPESRMVSGHRELRHFFLDNEIFQILLLRKFVPETETFIVQTETDDHDAVCPCLSQGHGHLVAMISYGRFLAPDRLPNFVK